MKLACLCALKRMFGRYFHTLLVARKRGQQCVIKNHASCVYPVGFIEFKNEEKKPVPTNDRDTNNRSDCYKPRNVRLTFYAIHIRRDDAHALVELFVVPLLSCASSWACNTQTKPGRQPRTTLAGRHLTSPRRSSRSIRYTRRRVCSSSLDR